MTESTVSNVATYDAPGSDHDRKIHWSAVVAGLFATLATLVVMTVLGYALGMSTYDYGDRYNTTFGMGAGAWAVFSAVVAFLFGGWFAARLAHAHYADTGRSNRHAVLQGLMVWFVAIPLVMLVTAGGWAMLADQNRNYARAGAHYDQRNAMDNATPAAERVMPRGTAGDTDLAGNPTMTRNERGEVERPAARAAWGTLASLVLGLAAAGFGGYLASGHVHFNVNVHHRGHRNYGPAHPGYTGTEPGTTTPVERDRNAPSGPVI
jgi:hypothetical protein